MTAMHPLRRIFYGLGNITRNKLNWHKEGLDNAHVLLATHHQPAKRLNYFYTLRWRQT
jgi:hypothetical protein